MPSPEMWIPRSPRSPGPAPDARLDRRWSHRRRERFPVVVYRSFLPVAGAQTRDISLEGLFLEMDAQGWEPGTVVDVEISLFAEDDDGYGKVRVQALMTRVTRDGAALMFLTFNRYLFSIFQRILYR